MLEKRIHGEPPKEKKEKITPEIVATFSEAQERARYLNVQRGTEEYEKILDGLKGKTFKELIEDAEKYRENISDKAEQERIEERLKEWRAIEGKKWREERIQKGLPTTTRPVMRIPDKVIERLQNSKSTSGPGKKDLDEGFSPEKQKEAGQFSDMQEKYPQVAKDREAERRAEQEAGYEPLGLNSYSELIADVSRVIDNTTDPEVKKKFEQLRQVWIDSYLEREAHNQKVAQQREQADTLADMSAFEEQSQDVTVEQPVMQERDPMKDAMIFTLDDTIRLLKMVVEISDDPQQKADLMTRIEFYEKLKEREEPKKEKGLPPAERLQKLQEVYAQNKDTLSERERRALLSTIDQLQKELGQHNT